MDVITVIHPTCMYYIPIYIYNYTHHYRMEHPILYPILGSIPFFLYIWDLKLISPCPHG